MYPHDKNNQSNLNNLSYIYVKNMQKKMKKQNQTEKKKIE